MNVMNGKRKVDHLHVEEKAAKRPDTNQNTSSHNPVNTLPPDGDADRHFATNGNGKHVTASMDQQDNTNDTGYGMQYNTNGSASSSGQLARNRHPVEAHHSVLPLTMQLMKPFWSKYCEHCRRQTGRHHHQPESTPSFIGPNGEIITDASNLFCGFIEKKSEESQSPLIPSSSKDMEHENEIMVAQSDNQISAKDGDNGVTERTTSSNVIRQRKRSADLDHSKRNSHLESIPPTPRDHTLSVLSEYIAATKMYGCRQSNPGVLTTLRFSLPTLRVSGSFHDSDMLALSEVLFRHCNGALKHIRRLDFSIAGRYGKLHGRKGFGSHGAFTLSRVLCISKHIEEVFMQKNRIGPYGSAAIFAAVAKNRVVKVLIMRRCMVGEKGALAFAEHIGKSHICALKEVDLSVNSIGFRGSITIEQLLIEKEEKGISIDVDLEGNLVIQEIMNGVTHGLGVILCFIGAWLLSSKVSGGGHNKVISCGAYSVSLLVLYISSTLYHSFFALKYTRYIFECLDHCAIYILITGSYTPFLRIALEDKPLGSTYLLIFLYLCCAGGVFVEAFYNTWVHKPKFSLTMYLGMGWSCLICMPDLMEVLPREATNLIILGGVGYTSGVPFFVRNNNLDHSIWHCFVLAGSIFHWFCVYLYVAEM